MEIPPPTVEKQATEISHQVDRNLIASSKDKQDQQAHSYHRAIPNLNSLQPRRARQRISWSLCLSKRMREGLQERKDGRRTSPNQPRRSINQSAVVHGHRLEPQQWETIRDTTSRRVSDRSSRASYPRKYGREKVSSAGRSPVGTSMSACTKFRESLIREIVAETNCSLGRESIEVTERTRANGALRR